MKVCFVSGKGGVGKSAICASLAYYLRDWVVVDADVDSPTLPLWLGVEWEQIERLKIHRVARVDLSKCVKCGKCDEVCRFGAIERGVVDEVLCEGCGACAAICPTEAISLEKVESGEVRIGRSRYGHRVVGGRTLPGHLGSGKLVSEVKKRAQQFGENQLIDGAPGVSCAAISAITGCNLAFLIAEPSEASLQGLKRVAELCRQLKVPYRVVLNKRGLNPRAEEKIRKEFEVVAEIPFEREVYSYLCRLEPPEPLFPHVKPLLDFLK